MVCPRRHDVRRIAELACRNSRTMNMPMHTRPRHCRLIVGSWRLAYREDIMKGSSICR